MILTEQEANSRLNSPNNLANRFSKKKEVIQSTITISSPNEPSDSLPDSSVKTPTEVTVFHETDLRRGERGQEISPLIKDTIAILARTGEDPTSIANTFGVTEPAISRIKHDRNKKHDQADIQETCNILTDTAIAKFMLMADSMNADKIADAKFKELAPAMSSMAKVIGVMNPKSSGDGNKIEVHIHTPNLRDESSYHVIEA